MKLKIRKVGNSYGVLFPEELIKRLRVTEGDLLYVVDNPEGVTLTVYDPEFEKAMKAYEHISKKYRHALRELAK
jgi:putative addiction module antidote